MLKEDRLKMHMLIEQCECIDQLKVLCRSLVERDIAYQELLRKHGIHKTVPAATVNSDSLE